MSREEEYLRRMRALGYEPSLAGMDDEDIEWELNKMDQGQQAVRPAYTQYRPVDKGLEARILRQMGQPYDPKFIPKGEEFYIGGWDNGEEEKPVLFASTTEGGQNGFLFKAPKLQGPGPNPPSTQLQDTFPSGYIPRRSEMGNSATVDDDDKKEIISLSEFKKRYGSLIDEKAKELGVDPDLLGATIWVESSGSGFSDGKLKLRFENHHFIDKAGQDYGLFSGKEWNVPHFYRESSNEPWKLVHSGDQYDEHAAFESAKQLNPEAAHNSASMGMGQIMGFNHKAAGYNSAKEMFDDFCKGHKPQINGMVSFIRNDKEGNLLKALQNRDLREYVRLYNGAGDDDSVAKYLEKLQEGITSYQDN